MLVDDAFNVLSIATVNFISYKALTLKEYAGNRNFETSFETEAKPSIGTFDCEILHSYDKPEEEVVPSQFKTNALDEIASALYRFIVRNELPGMETVGKVVLTATTDLLP
jgi:hypothetical protein